MKIALLGYGKMGKMIEASALQRGHSIMARTSRDNDAHSMQLDLVDVCIDFSHPQCVMQNIRSAIQQGKSLVVGTTGWYEHLDTVKQWVNSSQIGFIYSPNFSIGVNLFLKIVEEAAGLLHNFPEYDVGITEAHHNQKADSPSGTAKAIADVLLKKIKRKKKILANASESKIDPAALHIASLRSGSIPGKHSVIFDSPADAMTITHEARNREGFANGAVAAAEWLKGKRGFFTIDDMLGG